MNAGGFRSAAEHVVRHLRTAGHTALFAGGCVRDLLLGLTPKDYDVVTDALPEQVVALFPRTRSVGAKFGVVLVRIHGVDVEVATFRADTTYSDGRHPDAVVFGDPQADARRRDFTINGMYYDPFEQHVIDYVGGQADLQAKLVRAIGEPQQRFEEDHLRMLRAVRLTARLGFTLDPPTFAAIRVHAAQLQGISRERIRQELELIVAHPSRARGWTLLWESGLSDYLLSGLRWDPTTADAAHSRLTALPPDSSDNLALAALLRAWSPADLEQRCHESTFSNDTIKGVIWLLANLPALLSSETLELADLKLLMAQRRFAELTHLARAEYAVLRRPVDALDQLAARAAALDPAAIAPPRFVTGNDLLALGMPPGPDIARVLQAVYRAQLNGAVTDRQGAMRLARDLSAPDAMP